MEGLDFWLLTRPSNQCSTWPLLALPFLLRCLVPGWRVFAVASIGLPFVPPVGFPSLHLGLALQGVLFQSEGHWVQNQWCHSSCYCVLVWRGVALWTSCPDWL